MSFDHDTSLTKVRMYAGWPYVKRLELNCYTIVLMSEALEFKALIQILGINPYVLVDANKASRLKPGWRKPMPVIIQVNYKPDLPWHINLMPVGNGDFYLYLHSDVRKASKTKVGDRVTVHVWFDHTYRNGPSHAMPQGFKNALDQNVAANKNWDGLSPSRKKEVLRYFAGLKSEVVLERNILRAIYVLEGNSERFMARDWINGK
jgi:hypothetical protein